MRDVWILAEGNSRIGLGHQMRCLSIADALRERGVEATFLAAGQESVRLPESRGYRVCLLPETGRGAYLRALAGSGRPLFLLDSYAITPAQMEALRPLAVLAYLDDAGTERWPVDCLINYNLYAPQLPYETLYPAARPYFLLGSGYAPLRKAFADCRCALRRQVRDVLITTGGADACNVAGRLAGHLTDGATGEIRYHVVSGPFHTFREELLALAQRRPALVVHENVTQMARLMERCDLAVSAAGSTLYELCAVGVPTVCFHFVDNQELPARHFADRTAMPSCGNAAQDPDGVLRRLYRTVRRLEGDYAERVRIAESMREITDGRGAERIAACLIKEFLTDN